MNWYEAIYIRKSVRHYSTKAVPAALVKQIENCAEKLHPLMEEENAGCFIRIYPAKEARHKIKGIFRVSAPYYMAVFTKNTPFALVEAGYYAQELVLYMTTKGLGTCYQGCCRLAKSEIPKDSQLAVIIAFGYAEKALIRNAEHASRYSLNKLCHFQENTGDELRGMLKAARLAPSAMNQQPWRFAVWSNRIELYLYENPFLKHVSPDSASSGQLLDMGIVLCHLLAAADEQWIPVEVSRDEKRADTADESKNRKDRKYRYIATVKF